MVKLNYDIYPGMPVSIPPHLSWQADRDKIGGDYEVVEAVGDRILLRNIKNGRSIFLDRRCLAYLTGTDVPKMNPYEPLDADKYLPSPSECDYATEEEGEQAEFGFWYSSSFAGLPYLESSMLEGTWCYYVPHPFPW